MSIESLPVSRLVLLALAEEYLTPAQAMETCIAYGQSIEELRPFEVERFWLRQRWLSPEQIDRLSARSMEWSLFQAPRTVLEDTAVLLSIQQMLRQLHQTPASAPQWGLTAQAEALDTTDEFGFDSGESKGFVDEEEETESDEDTSLQTVPIRHLSKEDNRPEHFLLDDTDAFPVPYFPPGTDSVEGEEGFSVAVTVGSPPPWDEAPHPKAAASWAVHDQFASRYEVRPETEAPQEAGVERVLDRNLERVVTRLTVAPGDRHKFRSAGHFVLGMRFLGQLEHPTIPVVYDLSMHKRVLYATTATLPGTTFAQVLEAGTMPLWSQMRVLERVCESLAYAHSRGVVHRRIHPDHILLGSHGEVYVVGWEFAEPAMVADDLRLMLADDLDVLAQMNSDTRYMAPEWLSAGVIEAGIDQYALGVLMYRCLTGSFPFQGANTFGLLFQANMQEPASPHLRAPERAIPIELSNICMRMLARQPSQRYASMDEVLAAFRGFEQETFGQEHREMAANALVAEARLLAEQCDELSVHADELQSAWESLLRKVEPWQSVEEKQELWEKEAAVANARKEATVLFGAAVKKYLQALEPVPHHGRARRGLAALYGKRYLEAERQEQVQEQRYFRDLVALYDDEGSWKAKLEATVEIAWILPVHATLTLFRYELIHQRWQAQAQPEWDPLATHTSMLPGSYVLRCEASDGVVAQAPFVVVRGAPATVEVRLAPHRPGLEAFCLIQGGITSTGGDLLAPGGLPIQTHTLDDFWMSRLPVTMREYIAFLNAIHGQDPVEARMFVPRVEGKEAFVKLNAEGWYVPNTKTLWMGATGSTSRTKEPKEEWELPVFGVSLFDAIMYCRWRSSQLGWKVSLPTEEQWERAASGAEHRAYPWGDHFDASFCKMGYSRPPHQRTPEPVGAFSSDVSAFGVADMAGGMCEWTLPLPQQEMDALHEAPSCEAVIRGGCWRDVDANMLRIGARRTIASGSRSREVGFRLISSIEECLP